MKKQTNIKLVQTCAWGRQAVIQQDNMFSGSHSDLEWRVGAEPVRVRKCTRLENCRPPCGVKRLSLWTGAQ
jgi:hypothetical protein